MEEHIAQARKQLYPDMEGEEVTSEQIAQLQLAQAVEAYKQEVENFQAKFLDLTNPFPSQSAMGETIEEEDELEAKMREDLEQLVAAMHTSIQRDVQWMEEEAASKTAEEVLITKENMTRRLNEELKGFEEKYQQKMQERQAYREQKLAFLEVVWDQLNNHACSLLTKLSEKAINILEKHEKEV